MTAREQAGEVDVAGLREVAQAANDAPMSSTERLLAWDTYMGATYPDVVLALLDRLERAEAAVARVEALADEIGLAADLRAGSDNPYSQGARDAHAFTTRRLGEILQASGVRNG